MRRVKILPAMRHLTRAVWSASGRCANTGSARFKYSKSAVKVAHSAQFGHKTATIYTIGVHTIL